MAKSLGIENIGQKSIYDLLHGGKTYEVPFFQRVFSWTQDNWNDLITDIKNLSEIEKEHFFGFMTFKKGNKSDFDIIEGQQRLTTITIFLCAIRDLCNEYGLNKIESEIQNTFIKSTRPFDPKKDAVYNLTLSWLNKDYFKDYVLKPCTLKKKEEGCKTLKNKNPSNRLIFNCYKFFHNKISNDLSGSSHVEKENLVSGYLNTLLYKFIFINTEVTNNIVAYNIFQTLNDRGLDLALSDILKIHLCTLVDNPEDFIEEYWDDVRGQLSGNMDKFLRHHWLSEYGVVKETKLLTEIQHKIVDNDSAIDYLETLEKEVETYEALLNPTSEYWYNHGKDK